MERKFLIAANWKMFPAPFLGKGTESTLSGVEGPRQGHIDVYKPRENVDVVVFPTFLDLRSCIEAGLTVGAQYGHPEDSGAHTGDISMAMLKAIGCQYVLCGHSERRAAHHETDDDVASQVASALQHGLHPIVCIGETWEERKAGRQKERLQKQLHTILRRLDTTNYKLQTTNSSITIAYEPVWAISGGDLAKPAATPEDAEAMHAFIRSLLPTFRISDGACPELCRGGFRIVYGGSMKPENAKTLLAKPNIDGGLVGNASLDPKKFEEIVGIAEKLRA